MNSQMQVEIWRLKAHLQKHPEKASMVAIKYKTDYLLLKNKYKLLNNRIDKLIKEIASLPKDSAIICEAFSNPTRCSLSIEQKFDLESFKRSLKSSNNKQSEIFAVDYFKRYSALDFKYQNMKNQFFQIQKTLFKKG